MTFERLLESAAQAGGFERQETWIVYPSGGQFNAVNGAGTLIGAKADPGLVTQTLVTAMASSAGNAVGYIGYAPLGTAAWTTVILPGTAGAGTPNRSRLVIRQGGGTIFQPTEAMFRFANAAPADFDTFGELDVDGLRIDATNTASLNATHGIFLSNQTAGGTPLRQNIRGVRFTNCRVWNVPAPGQSGAAFTQRLYGFTLATQHAAAAEGTLTSIRDILIRDVRMEDGGDAFALITGATSGAQGTGYNQWIDNVVSEDCYYNNALAHPIQRLGIFGFQIGSLARVGYCRVQGFYSYGTGDVSVEIDNAATAECLDCEHDEAHGNGFYFVNFNAIPDESGAALTGYARQTCVVRDNHVERQIGYDGVNANTGLVNGAAGYQLSASGNNTGGRFVFDNCSYHRNTGDWGTSAAGSVNGEAFNFQMAAFRELSLVKPSYVIEGVSIASGSANSSPVFFGSGCAPDVCDITKGYGKVTANNAGGGSPVCRFVDWRGAAKVVSWEWDFFEALTGTWASTRLIDTGNGAAKVLDGDITFRLLATSFTNLTGLYVDSTTNLTIHRLNVHGDGRLFGTNNELSFNGNTNKVNVFSSDFLWRVFPKQPSAIALGASPAVYQNTDIYPEMVYLEATVNTTKVEVATDGATYSDTKILSGGIFLDNASSLRVTWITAAPAALKVPVK